MSHERKLGLCTSCLNSLTAERYARPPTASVRFVGERNHGPGCDAQGCRHDGWPEADSADVYEVTTDDSGGVYMMTGQE